ncbi:tcsA [Symbiodinium microadriaticum]|nr:tcsA [Symbiodinium microadriaticum]
MPLESFLNITDPIIEMANLRTIAFCPIITPDEVASFEAYAYDFFGREGYSHLGIRPEFGRGVYSMRNNVAFHDVNGSHLGRNRILTPVVQIGNLATNTPAVMFNLYSEQKRINAIDDMIDCFHASTHRRDCSAITDIVHLVQDPEFRPAVLVVHPLAPRYAPQSLKGLVYTVHNWDTIISYALPSYVSGLDVVLSVTGGLDYTYRINEGRAIFLGVGDKHDKKYSGDKVKVIIPYFQGSVDYTLKLYPTDHYVAKFKTDLPLYACILSVAVIVLTSLIFVVYDFFVNRQKYERELIINTKRLFVRFISHEIRTPMNTVHLGLNLLSSEMSTLVSKDMDLTPPAKAAIEEWLGLIDNIGDSSDAAIMVLNDLINYDKISMGMLRIDRELCSFWVVVGQAVRPFIVQAKQANVELRLNMQVQDGSGVVTEDQRIVLKRLAVQADNLKLTQVVRNLVSNAIKFTPEGGVISVTVVWDKLGMLSGVNATREDISTPTSVAPEVPRYGSLVLTVEDSGAGMTAENLKDLFQEGVQFNPNLLQAGGGSGLGLWISKGIVELHGGLISAHSDGLGRGSVFRLELPAYLSETSTEVEDMQLCPRRRADHHLSTLMASKTPRIRRVLVVDDSIPTRKMVTRMLRNAGYECIEASDGQMCVDVVTASLRNESEGGGHTADDSLRIDLILLDFEMPRMTGPEACSILRSKNIHTPVIGVTGNVLPADKNFFMANGADAVLHKPLTISVLQEHFIELNDMIEETAIATNTCRNEHFRPTYSEQESVGMYYQTQSQYCQSESQVTRDNVFLDDETACGDFKTHDMV